MLLLLLLWLVVKLVYIFKKLLKKIVCKLLKKLVIYNLIVFYFFGIGNYDISWVVYWLWKFINLMISVDEVFKIVLEYV